MSQGLVTFGNVMLPHWILHPVKASIEILLQVDNWCTYGYIPLGLRDLWLNACVPSYIQDYSIHCLGFARQVDPAMLAIASDSINKVWSNSTEDTILGQIYDGPISGKIKSWEEGFALGNDTAKVKHFRTDTKESKCWNDTIEVNILLE